VRIRTAVATLLAVVCVVAPAAAQTIASEPFASKVAAYGGVVVWSHWNAAASAFQLEAYVHGRDQLLPIKPESVPFDVDLGPDVHHHTVAVYSRCRSPQAVWELGIATKKAALPGGCAIYQYDFGTRREAKLKRIVGSGSFYLPTIWGNAIAYVRIAPGRGPNLYAQPLSPPTITVVHGTTKTKRTLRITAQALPGGYPGGTGPGPVALDLGAAGLALGWQGSDPSGAWGSQISLDTVPSPGSHAAPDQVTLDSESTSVDAPGFLSFPSLQGSLLYYGGFDAGALGAPADGYDRIGTNGSGPRSWAAPHALRSAAVDGGFTYTMYGPYAGIFGSCLPGACTLTATRGAR